MAPIISQLLLIAALASTFFNPAAADLTEWEHPEGPMQLNSRAAAVAIPSDASITAAVGSVPNTSWFWTGRIGQCRSEGDGIKDLAAKLASSHGGSTLEQRIATNHIQMPQFGTSPEAKKAWRFASGTYANKASGDAFVVLGKCVRAGNTWDTTEFPGLKQGGKVNCVYQFQDKDGYKAPTFLWAKSGQEASCQEKLKTGKGLYARYQAFTA
jgi:hypothetical protein